MIELLIAVSIMTFASASMLALMYHSNNTNWKVSNKLDATNQARIAVERMARDVRMGRSIGDVYGDPIQLSPPPNEVIGWQGSDRFPSINNPVYGGGAQPPGGWPTSWPNPPWQLSNTCLIVQVPIFYANPNNPADPMNGWPTMISAGNPPQNKDNVETHIYMVRQDPDQVNNPGEWQIQFFKAPGANIVNGYVAANNVFGPEVICKGIIGPLDPVSNQPKIFQFLDRIDATGTPKDAIDGPQAANYTGILVNLEIRKHDSGANGANARDAEGNTKHSSVVALKTEIFMRNNALATTTGNPNIAP